LSRSSDARVTTRFGDGGGAAARHDASAKAEASAAGGRGRARLRPSASSTRSGPPSRLRPPGFPNPEADGCRRRPVLPPLSPALPAPPSLARAALFGAPLRLATGSLPPLPPGRLAVSHSALSGAETITVAAGLLGAYAVGAAVHGASAVVALGRLADSRGADPGARAEARTWARTAFVTSCLVVLVHVALAVAAAAPNALTPGQAAWLVGRRAAAATLAALGGPKTAFALDAVTRGRFGGGLKASGYEPPRLDASWAWAAAATPFPPLFLAAWRAL